jgi:ribosomal protein S18 acetylase RimI-like enzyme
MVFRPFQLADQARVKSLILGGLRDRFQIIDPTLNPDLNDIWGNYIVRGGYFLVVDDLGKIIGAGALIPEDRNTGRLLRVSVDQAYRRQGIAHEIIRHLIEKGRKSGYGKIVVETNDNWYDAIGLYEKCGFTRYDHRDGEIHLLIDL